MIPMDGVDENPIEPVCEGCKKLKATVTRLTKERDSVSETSDTLADTLIGMSELMKKLTAERDYWKQLYESLFDGGPLPPTAPEWLNELKQGNLGEMMREPDSLFKTEGDDDDT